MNAILTLQFCCPYILTSTRNLILCNCKRGRDFVYKIPYRRKPRLAYVQPLGRVRRASKGILHTSRDIVKVFVHSRDLLTATKYFEDFPLKVPILINVDNFLYL